MATGADKERRAPQKRSEKGFDPLSRTRPATNRGSRRPSSGAPSSNRSSQPGRGERASRKEDPGVAHDSRKHSARSNGASGSHRPVRASASLASARNVRQGTRDGRQSVRGHGPLGVWTKDPKSAAAPSYTWAHEKKARASAGSSSARRGGASSGQSHASLLQRIGKGIFSAFGAFLRFVTGSVARMAVCALVAMGIIAFCVDAVLTNGHAYAGVSIGSVDVSGMTREEAVAAVNDAYAVRVAGATAIVYSSEKVRSELEAGNITATETIEESSIEQARDSGQAWTPTAASLEASVPTERLVDEAFRVGREDGGVFERIRSMLFGRSIEPTVDFNHASIESLAESIDASIGEPRVDWGVSVQGGVAVPTSGSDGSMVNRTWLESQLAAAYLAEDGAARSFVAEASFAPVRIDEEIAQSVCDQVNAAIGDGASFVYRGASWYADATALGSWVAFETLLLDESGQISDDQPIYEDVSGSWTLVASIDREKAAPVILENIKAVADEDPLSVSFVNEDGAIYVETNSEGEVPLVGDAADTLNAALFGDYPVSDGDAVEISISAAQAPDRMSFDEAVDYGVITAFSSFTTEYTTGAGTEARNHNIHLAADLLDGSIAKANGGVWSFNETAGNCNEEKGFQAAGAIVAGEYTDSIGGGICQVATTVYNSVYESGLAIVLRYNHSLYISSYPEGRDAAVSWPDLDLAWRNDESSDVLLRMSYTDSSVTATLYGVDPEYTVASEVGEWVEGEKHSTRYVEDASLSKGASYVQTAGSDGKSITVVRIVKNASGAILREEAFTSVYEPKTEVVVVGPGFTPPEESENE